ncbi:MAG: o-succinylbenzoate synthase [Streptosporangiaceae bacterium]
MRLEALELVRVRMPLVRPFRTSFGTQTGRNVLLVRALTDTGEGWGECVAGDAPTYNEEWADGAEQVIRHWLAPALFAEPALTAARVAPALARIRGHRMAKAALEAAVLDARLRAAGMPLADFLGGVRGRVEAGVSIGMTPTVGQLLDVVASHLDEGYRRVKLKIEPGFDEVPVAAVRERFGDDLPLQVDANTAYRRADIPHLLRLDPFGILLVEQPFPPGDLGAHAELARRSTTPVCLDESIESADDAVAAIEAGACSIVNIKAGRVGGFLEARRVHDVCAAHGVPVWCGGMLETGVGRAANVALAALPGFTLPGDTSASGRYYATDVTAPFTLVDGCLEVPNGPGTGVDIRDDVLADLGASRETLKPTA